MAGSAGDGMSGAGGAAGGASGGTAGVDPALCPAQTAPVAPSGTDPEQEAGPAVESTATRPQLSEEEAATYTILKALAHGGQFVAPMPATGGAAGAAGSAGTAGTDGAAGMAGAGAGGMAGSAGESAMSLAGAAGDTAGTSGAAGSAGMAGTAGSAGMAGTAGSAGTAGMGGAAGSGGIMYAVNDDWDPVTNGIGDVSQFVPGFTVAADGTGTHTTIQAAIDTAILLAECPRVYILIKPGTYRESILIPAKTSAPPITLYSTEADASQVVIAFNNSASGSPMGEPINPGISASATFTNSLPRGFQAKNLTIANDYEEGSLAGDDQAGVALLNQGDKAQYENVRFLGNRYTLYVKSTATNQVSRTYFRDCYIEGDDSFISGRGTAVFDHTEVRWLTSRVTTGGVIATPSTDVGNPYGMLFISSQFTADEGATGVYLGQQWFEGDREGAVGKMVIRNSTLGTHILPDPWLATPDRVTPKNATPTASVLYTSDDFYVEGTSPTPLEKFLAEYGNVTE
jgi:pectinesterase